MRPAFKDALGGLVIITAVMLVIWLAWEFSLHTGGAQ